MYTQIKDHFCLNMNEFEANLKNAALISQNTKKLLQTMGQDVAQEHKSWSTKRDEFITKKIRAEKELGICFSESLILDFLQARELGRLIELANRTNTSIKESTKTWERIWGRMMKLQRCRVQRLQSIFKKL